MFGFGHQLNWGNHWNTPWNMQNSLNYSPINQQAFMPNMYPMPNLGNIPNEQYVNVSRGLFFNTNIFKINIFKINIFKINIF